MAFYLHLNYRMGYFARSSDQQRNVLWASNRVVVTETADQLCYIHKIKV